MKKQLVLMLLLLSSNFVMAQFDNKFSINVGATYWNPNSSPETYQDYKMYYRSDINSITEEYEESEYTEMAGYGINFGLQYNISRRFSIEGLVRFSFIEFSDYNNFDYVDFEAIFLENVYTEEGSQKLYTIGNYKGRNDAYELAEGQFFNFDFAIVPKFFLNPSNKFKLYIYSELHLNYSAGGEFEYIYLDDYESSSEKVNNKELDGTEGIYFGFIPGLGFDFPISNNLGFYAQGGYSLAQSYKDYIQVQCGLRISAFKSKSL